MCAGRGVTSALAWNPVFGFFGLMNENTGAAEKNPRKERLAKALRENLKRRKAQARERAAEAEPKAESGRASARKD
jgi:hypothetical protein